MGEEDHIHQTGRSRGDKAHDEQAAAAVELLHHGSHQQQEHHVAHIVAQIRMTQHMAEQAHIGQRV